MHDARDAEDKRLLDEGEHKRLLGNYFDVVRERAFLRLRNRDEADDVAQQVFLRLLGELKGGKTYNVPFRVVVHMVLEWTLRGFYPGAKSDFELPEDWSPEAPDAYAEWEERFDLAALFGDLPERQRQVAELRYLERLEPAEIAERLQIEPNAVHQALHNAHANLRKKLGG